MSMWTGKSNGKSKLANRIELSHKEDDDFVDEVVENLNQKIKMLEAQLTQKDVEICQMRTLNDTNTMFLQKVIMELIEKNLRTPAPATALTSYLTKKNENTIGPKGKLP